MEPEEYFTRFAQDRLFDVIVIRAGERSEEAFRWFCSSLSHAHARTLWIFETLESDDVPLT